MKNPHLVTQALLAVLLGLMIFDRFHPAVAPAPAAPAQPANSALAEATKAYRDNLGGTFSELARSVRLGHVTTKAQGVSSLAAGRQPLGDALNATFDARCDTDGTIKDPAGLAADLDAAAKAMGAK